MPENGTALLPGPWAEAARWVESRLGLHYPPRLWPDLERGLAAAARRLDLPDARACAERALAGRLNAAQLQTLAECLTIGETYFFRDPALFEQLATQVLQPLIAERRSGSRHLRLWSAGCSTGEEPYSLAMLVAQLLPDWREWNIAILATDVSAAALQKGRAGSYGPWSLRGGIPPACLPFLRAGADGRRHVDPALRRLVRFARLNLAGTDYPASATLTTGMDLVLCRNVLIYFEPARVRAVLERLGRALVPQGWLVSGSVELPRGGVPGLRTVRSNGLFALRPGGAGASATPMLAPRQRAATVVEAAPFVEAAPIAASAASAASAPASPLAPMGPLADPPAPAPADPAPAQQLLQEARRLADGGDLQGAQVVCRAALQRHKLDPDASYLLASILAEAGAPQEAMALLQRSLYLDPAHLLARFSLGSLALSQGRVEAGRRHLERALAQLDGVPPDAVLQGSGGLTAAALQGALRRLHEVHR